MSITIRTILTEETRKETPTMSQETSSASSCCSTTSQVPAATQVKQDNLLTDSTHDLTTCPVMVGTSTSKSTAEASGLYRDFDGNRYWFCCAGCGPAFDADPAKYAANMA